MRARDRKNLLIYLLMIAPGLLVYLYIIAYPVFYSVWLSLTDYNPVVRDSGWSFVGLDQYIKMLHDPNFWHSLKNNIIVVLVSVFGQIPIGLILAYILYRKIVRAQNFFQSIVFLPQFLSTIVIGLLWKRLFVANGPVSRLIQLVTGNPEAQFTMMLYKETIMIPIGIALIWMYTGLYMVIFLANLQRIDEGLVEAAQIDGASEFQVFTRIIVPVLSGAILVSSLLAIAGSLRGFDFIFALTTQGLQRNNAMVLSIFMYQTAFQDYTDPMRYAYGSAISNMIVIISVILILISNYLNRKFNPGEER